MTDTRDADPASRIPEPPSSAPASLTGRPHLMPLLLGADEACEREDWDEALDAYKKALMMVLPGDHAAQATIYANIAEVKLAQGSPREAESNFEKALAAVPTHRRSIEALIDLAVAAREPRRAIDARRKLVHALDDPPARVHELERIAETQAKELDDPRAALETLEEARAIAPDDLALLERLRALLEKMHRWPRMSEVIGAMALAAKTPRERAHFRFVEADLVLGRLRDEPRGVALLERALDEDETCDEARDALVSVLAQRQQWQHLDAVWVRLIERHAKKQDPERAWNACQKLGVLRRDKLRDGPGALEAFTGAVSIKRDDVDTRMMLVDLHLARGDEPAALAELETVALIAPLRASSYARLFSLHARAGRTDRAWLAASALVELGHAQPEHVDVEQRLRKDGTWGPTKGLGHEAWDTLLRAPGADEVVTGILGAIIPAAVKMRLAELDAKNARIALDPSRKQPVTSTASIIRCFSWASQVLGVTLPELYLHDEVPGDIAAVQAEPPATVLGPRVTQGMSSPELAFLVGRHLAYYRPEHYALVFFPTLPELTRLFLGALKLALPEVPIPIEHGEAVARVRGDLAKLATLEEREWLEAAVGILEDRGGQVDLAAWSRSVELSACRAGLLLCGDLAVATRRVRSEERAIADVTAEDRRNDLLAFCASSELARLREVIGVTARPSTIPPPPPSRAR